MSFSKIKGVILLVLVKYLMEHTLTIRDMGVNLQSNSMRLLTLFVRLLLLEKILLCGLSNPDSNWTDSDHTYYYFSSQNKQNTNWC